MCSACTPMPLVSAPPLRFISDPHSLPEITRRIHDEIKTLPSVMIMEKFKELSNIHGIVFVGSSASGKTTVVNSVRSAVSDSTDVVIPRRYITRPPRMGDDLTENLHITLDDLLQKIKNGSVSVSWVRHMEGNRVEHYGFEETDKKKLALYSANNDFCRRTDGIGKQILVVGVYAPDEIRKQRLMARSPDMNPAEAAYRLGDSSENIVSFSHVLLQNYGPTEQTALSDICALVQSVVKNRVRWGEIKELGNPQVEYRSRLFDIVNHDVAFSDGTVKRFQYAERSPGVRTLITHGGKILMTKEWREESGSWDFRLPGGKVFEEVKDYKHFLEIHPDKNLLQTATRLAAAREVLEEVGLELIPENLILSHTSKCGSLVQWDLYYYQIDLQRAPSSVSEVMTSESEVIQNVWLSPEEVRTLCLEDRVSEDRTVSFLLKHIERQHP